MIDDGVGKDDWVIVNGLQRARPGAVVNPEHTEMTSQATSKTATPEEPKATPTGPTTAAKTNESLSQPKANTPAQPNQAKPTK